MIRGKQVTKYFKRCDLKKYGKNPICLLIFFSIAGEPNGSVISLKVLGILQFGCITFNTPFGPKIWVT